MPKIKSVMIGTAFLFYFSTNSFAESTLVVGNRDSLVALTHTRYLDDSPVLFFSEQIERGRLDLLLNKIDNIVFYDNTWQDLGAEFACYSEIIDRVEMAYIFSQDGEFYVPRGRSYNLKARVVYEPIESGEERVRGQTLHIDNMEEGSDPVNPEPLLEIDDEKFFITDYPLEVYLKEGEHKIKLLSNDNFKVDLAILEPVSPKGGPAFSWTSNGEEPEIIFRKINPTKYEVKVERARGPFWLVFSESFHEGWRAYARPPVTSYQLPVTGKEEGMNEIVARYPKFGVKEARHLTKFTPQDIEYLFRTSDIKEHYLVNGYTNGWYIDPKELGLDEDFRLVLYFWPQSLFYLGLGILGLTLMGCIGWKFINEKNS